MTCLSNDEETAVFFLRMGRALKFKHLTPVDASDLRGIDTRARILTNLLEMASSLHLHLQFENVQKSHRLNGLYINM